ncbi:FHA domain-containing protein [Cellulomonas sp. Leaf334]|uniref:FHA domain-containing protein n=1 Tax=Cellulomonas sp. Leaf334 TaxID=1736339 RepID=UPI000701821B|nr:FHA domain-containing protein [Cellulomonas sp. Leaf334]KQR16530.1 hypothetical protein ASF78_03925 [Cellulomonas sp. Leaf334]
MSVPEYSAGDWTAVVRPGFVALLGPGAAESTVRALWQDSGEGVFAALALLARDGFGGLPPFAVVSVDGRRVHAALRGDVEVVVEVDGRQEVWRSGEVSTWTERVLDGVADVAVQADGAPVDAASLPLADGVAAASRVRLALTARDVLEVVPTAAPATNPVGVEPVVADEPVVAEPVDAESVDAESVDAEQAVDEQVVPHEVETPVAPAVVEEELPAEVESSSTGIVDSVPWATTSHDPDSVPTARIVDVISWDEPTQVELVPVAGSDADASGVEADASPDRPDPSGVVAAAESFLTSPFGPRGTDAPAAPLPVGGASLDDHDGLTILSTDLAEIREQLPSWASDELPGPFRTPPVASPSARLVLSTGLVVPLDRAVLLGRAPQVARVTNRELPRLITVPSPQQDISRTHAEVRVEGEHVVVTDLDSTNGIHVTRPGEGARRLHPGEPSVVGVDEVVDLGDGVTFSVERGS